MESSAVNTIGIVETLKMSDETITIKKEFYDELLRDSLWLQALEAAGVDNWDGIDYAHEIHLEILDDNNE